MPKIAGIDGCKDRWLAISRVPGEADLEARVLTTSELASQVWDVAAIDIPIGMPENCSRAADVEARKLIGPRASSVFPCPVRPVLKAGEWEEACEISFHHAGKRLSRQSFGILEKIRAVDELVRSGGLSERFFEIHPEVSFAAWNRKPMLFSKKDLRGMEDRRVLIADYFGADAFAGVVTQIESRSVALDDIADAFAALWSAERIFAGTAQRLPEAAVKDSTGLPMHIWY